jgi:hypothetical protein
VNGTSVALVVKFDRYVPAGFALIPRSMGMDLDGPVGIKIQIAENVAA